MIDRFLSIISEALWNRTCGWYREVEERTSVEDEYLTSPNQGSRAVSYHD